MPLGMEVDLGADHIMLDGNPAAPSKKGAQPLSHTQFWPMSVVSKRLDGEIRLSRPGDVGWGPSSSATEMGTVAPPPTFRPTLLWHGRPPQLLLSTCRFRFSFCMFV